MKQDSDKLLVLGASEEPLTYDLCIKDWETFSVVPLNVL